MIADSFKGEDVEVPGCKIAHALLNFRRSITDLKADAMMRVGMGHHCNEK